MVCDLEISIIQLSGSNANTKVNLSKILISKLMEEGSSKILNIGQLGEHIFCFGMDYSFQHV